MTTQQLRTLDPEHILMMIRDLDEEIERLNAKREQMLSVYQTGLTKNHQPAAPGSGSAYPQPEYQYPSPAQAAYPPPTQSAYPSSAQSAYPAPAQAAYPQSASQSAYPQPTYPGAMSSQAPGAEPYRNNMDAWYREHERRMQEFRSRINTYKQY